MLEGIVLFVVVKVNGYGYGVVEFVKVVKKGGVIGFCVVLLDEVIELREVGV